MISFHLPRAFGTARGRGFTHTAARTLTLLVWLGLCACTSSSTPRITRGCGASGERQPDTSNPVRQKRGALASPDEPLTWEELTGERPRTFDASAPEEPPAEE